MEELLSMGFSEELAAQAVSATRGRSTMEAAEWLLDHHHHQHHHHQQQQQQQQLVLQTPEASSLRSKQATVDRFFSTDPPSSGGKPLSSPPHALKRGRNQDAAGGGDGDEGDEEGEAGKKRDGKGNGNGNGTERVNARATEKEEGSRVRARVSKIPLAERMRPCSVDEVLGQDHLVGPGGILRLLIEAKSMASVILWGPPGSGKTSLARAISRSIGPCRFVAASAVTSGVKEVREILDEAKRRSRSGLRTLFFMDEVHRFNKAQQDAFLPSIESGDVTFIGATTENPSFELNPALLSRCKVLTLNKIQPEIIEHLLKRALADTEKGVMAGIHEDPFVQGVQAEEDALAFLSQAADGDARAALNALEIAVASAVSREKQHLAFNESCTGKDSCDVKGEALKQNDVSLATSDPTQPSELAGCGGAAGIVTVRLADVSEALQRSHILYDKKGEEHYNIISALHKSMRGGDPDAALYWLARMLEGGEGPLYIARRLVRFASEDIGLADLQALTLAVACYQSCHFLGMPECNVHLAQCVAYLALAPKSVAVYQAINEAQEWVKKRGNEPVPLHLRNAPTGLMRQLGYGRGYIYPPNCEGPVEQDYFPPSLRGHKFLKWP